MQSSFSNTTELNLLASMYNKIANVNGLVESLNESPKQLLSNFISSDDFTLFDKENQDKQQSIHQRKMSLIRTSESGESNTSSSSLSPVSSTSPPNHQASLSRSSSLSSLLNSAVSLFENHNSFGILGTSAATPNQSLPFDVVDDVATSISNDLTSSLSSSFDTNSPITGSSPPLVASNTSGLVVVDSVVDTSRMTPVELDNFWWNMNQLIQMYMQQELLVQSTLNQSSTFRPQQQLQRKTPNPILTAGGGIGRPPMSNNFKMMNQSPILPQPPALIKYAGACSNKNQYPTMKPMPAQQQQQNMFPNNNRLFGRVITNNRGFVAQRAY